MKLLLDTSTPVCKLAFVKDDETYVQEWQADRQLADGLLGFLEEQLAKNNAVFSDIDGIAVMKGPGSFTGLRIGITVLNTIADTLQIPIVGETGDDWQQTALGRLEAGENDQLVLPLYGRDANITAPRK